MKLTNIVNDIFVLNLDRRVDRLQNFIEESEKHSFDFTKIRAIDGNQIKNNTKLRNGELGLLLSYASLIMHAESAKLSSILICEDDVVFYDSLEERLEKEWPEIPADFDLVYLGCNRDSLGAGQIPAEKVTDNVLRVKSVFGMHCHLIKDTVYDEILSLIERLDRPLDVLYTDIQQKYKAYGFAKNLCYQKDNYSDIINTVPSYQKAGIFD